MGKYKGNYIDGRCLKNHYYCKEPNCNNEIYRDTVLYGKGRCHPCAGKNRGKLPEETKRKMRGRRKKRIKKKCLICYKKFILDFPHLSKIRKFCSRKCYIKSLKNRKITWGNKISKTNKGRKVSLESRIKSSLSHRGQHSSPKTEFKKGHKFPKEIRTRAIKNALKSLHQSPNKPEQILYNLLQKILPNQYKYVGDGSVLIEFFNPDFINKKEKKVIEMFGDYWHNIPKNKKKDYYRFKVYKRNGYNTLVVWECELKDLNKLKKKLLRF